MLTRLWWFCFLMLIFNPVDGHDWQIALREKIARQEFPHWMVKQINSDLATCHWDSPMVDLKKMPLLQIRIKNNQLFVNGKKGAHQACIISQTIVGVIQEIMKVAPLPDLCLLVVKNDSFYHRRELQKCPVPLFSFAKKKEHKGVILIPDWEILRQLLIGNPILEEVVHANKAYSWGNKIEKAFWRGANSGFNDRLEFMTLDTFHLYPRAQLVLISKENGDLIDAAFTTLPHTGPAVNELFKKMDFLKPLATIEEHLHFKYQILVDGYTCAFQRAYWQLFSNCLIFKQDSDDIQWYYEELKPYQHFIPVKCDFSDLVEKIKWAKSHDKEVEQIAKNAQTFAQTHLSNVDVALYVYLVLYHYAGYAPT